MSFDSDTSFFVPSPFDDADAGYTPYLEKDYCSNFVCCGLTLADLHELVSHFEENHVTVISPDGVPLPSPTSTDSPSDVSSLASPCSTRSTSPPPNLFPTLTSAFIPRESAFAPVVTSSSCDPGLAAHAYNRGVPSIYLAKEEQHFFDAMLHSEVYDPSTAAQAPLSPRPQICIPPAQFFPAPLQCAPSVVPQYTVNRASPPNQNAPTQHVYPPTLAPTPVYARHPNLSIITDLPSEPSKPAKKRKGENNASWVSPGEGEDALIPARRRKKGPVSKHPVREKMHKCPHAGCVKSYLNLNGLKYHLTKGVCDFNES